jgi:hypothetical protein
MPPSNGWSEWSKHVLAELERFNGELQTLNEKIEDLKSEELRKVYIEIATLKVKSSVWGGVAGLIAALIVLVLAYIERKGGK